MARHPKRKDPPPPGDDAGEPKMIGDTYAWCADHDPESLPGVLRQRAVNLYGVDPHGVLGALDWFEWVAPFEGENNLARQSGKDPGWPLKLFEAADRRFEQITGRLGVTLPRKPKKRKKGKPPE